MFCSKIYINIHIYIPLLTGYGCNNSTTTKLACLEYAGRDTVANKVPQIGSNKDIFNLLRPSDAIWKHRSGTMMSEEMTCGLMTWSHYIYLNQCWSIITETLQYWYKSNYTENTPEISPWYEFENHWLERKPIFFMGQWVEQIFVATRMKKYIPWSIPRTDENIWWLYSWLN